MDQAEQGEAVVVIATQEHRAALSQRLVAIGALATDAEHGPLVMLEAARCLAKLVVDGAPDRAAFRAYTTPVLSRLRAAGFQKIRLFGEIVNLLWPASHAATVQLEELWNELLVEYDVCLLCAYRIDPVDAELRRGLLHQITRCHSHSFTA